MVALPPALQEGGLDATLARLRDPAGRAGLAAGPGTAARGPLEDVRLSYVAAAEYRRHEGRTLAEAAREEGKGLYEFVCDVLLASGMAVGCVAPHRQRGEEDVR